MQKRTNFSFGGQSVRDRIKKRKSNAKIGNEVTKLERIIMSKKKEGVEENDEEEDEEGTPTQSKRQKT